MRWIGLVVLSITTTSISAGSQLNDPRLLSVLLVSPHFNGHVIPILTLGEELVKRGHKVTLITAPTDLVVREVERLNIALWSLGEDFLNSETVIELTGRRGGGGGLDIEALVQVSALFQERVLNMINNSTITSFDIMVTDAAFSFYGLCFSRKWGIPIVNLWPSLMVNPFILESWLYPALGSGYTDNLSFYQRLVSTVTSHVLSFMIKKYASNYFSSVGDICDETKTSIIEGVYTPNYLPQIIATSIGFEFPRTIFPFTDYVGPLISPSAPELPPNLAQWLDQRDARTVVYISMGSFAVLTKEQAEAIVNGANQANHSIVWSLRKSNQGVLDLMTYDPDSIWIASWVPQLSLLKHPSIHSAVLHGGMGGIQEALSCGVPIIVVPFMPDQVDNAAHVQHYKYGEMIHQHQLTIQLVSETLHLIDSEIYHNALRKIQLIYKKDGGVSRAADLLEFYSEVGYEHLIPAYAKYSWSWIAIHSVDVYAVLLLAVLLSGYLTYRFIRSCCSAILSRSKKKKE